MKLDLKNFDFALPCELIAQHPLAERSSSRLLILNKSQGDISHHTFKDILAYLNPNDLLVFNETKVIPARLYGHKHSGGKIEILIERILNNTTALAHVKSNRSLKENTSFILEPDIQVTMVAREENLFKLQLDEHHSWYEVVEATGEIPLPPYIQRSPEASDLNRYQTVYAKTKGSVAAPTAGLHFDDALLKALKKRGVDFAFVTLHVGAGTFQPIKTDNVLEHDIHRETMVVNQTVCEKVQTAKKNGGRVIAVGTTSTRALETAAKSGRIKPYQGDTKLFIYPGFEFHCIDGLITNFHLPKSSLLLLICAFAGYKPIMDAYNIAIKERYRFFSYGDAMLIL